jgi:hypothetical protein
VAVKDDAQCCAVGGSWALGRGKWVIGGRWPCIQCVVARANACGNGVESGGDAGGAGGGESSAGVGGGVGGGGGECPLLGEIHSHSQHARTHNSSAAHMARSGGGRLHCRHDVVATAKNIRHEIVAEIPLLPALQHGTRHSARSATGQMCSS